MKLLVRSAALILLAMGIMSIVFSVTMIIFATDESGEMLNALCEGLHLDAQQRARIKASVLPWDVLMIIVGMCFIVLGLAVDIHFEKLIKLCFGRTRVTFDGESFLAQQMRRRAKVML